MTKTKKPHLAQFNFARARFDPNDVRMQGFTSALDMINGMADSAPGFIWRLKTEQGHSIDVRPFPDDPLKLITLSTWTDIPSLQSFVYRSHHASFLKRRDEWFEHIDGQFLVLWWRVSDQPPSVAEGMDRLDYLRQRGPSPRAFDFSNTFPFQNALEFAEPT
ncbi:MAG: DUF3291 domain-containing protein [Pseudomonadota bacterium]